MIAGSTMCWNARRWLGLVVILAGALAPGRAWGWTATGHKVVAIIAWDELTPTTRAKLVDILKQHPRYEKDLLAGLPAGADEPTAARHAFAVAATWPDLVKSPANPMHGVANHPEWHYIDLPFCPDGPTTAPAQGQAGQAAAGAAPTGPRDIVEALQKNAEDLKNPATRDADKALAICWILHLGGDVHQPLHAAELFSSQFPEGDKGGNAMWVLRDPPYPNSRMNLHLLWDQLPGNYQSEQADAYLAAGLRGDPNLSRARLKDRLAVKDFAAWVRESHALAVKYAYLDGALKVAASTGHHAQPDADVDVPGVPPGYVEQAERVALRQVVLAGYRTADLLTALLDPNPPADAPASR